MAQAMQTTQATAVTQAQSLALIKNVIRVGVSTICHLRGLFRDDAFTTKDYAEMVSESYCDDAEMVHHGCSHALQKVRQLDPTKDDQVKQLSQWLEDGVFDALSKRKLLN